MNPVQAWVDALRSDKYEQTQKALCSLTPEGEPAGYCCLGVACELYRQTHHHLKIHDSHDKRSYGPNFSFLPNSVLNWLRGGDLAIFIDETLLAGMNDNGKNFYEIADYIEDHYLREEV